MRAYRRRKAYGRIRPDSIDATGTRRRLQALVAVGWSTYRLADELGRHRRMVEIWMHADRVRPETAQRVAELYDRLCMRPGPCARARQAAKQRNWPPPLAWDEGALDDPDASPNWGRKRDERVDQVAVMHALAGDSIALTASERRQVAARLVARGHSDREVGRRLGLSSDAICALRIRHGIRQPGHRYPASRRREAQEVTS